MAKAPSKTASEKKKSTSRSAPTANKTRRAKARTASSENTEMPKAPRAISPEERERMIQLAAYHIAERDGFQAGKEQDYWLQAEKQTQALFDANADVH